ncbi:hypothetical protein GS894_03065 [Rhodococcus hoagii]|uniref:hypothetical protein n=1 Tax=Rhodococcus hoagii TaxID=43767 RepID=UPI00197D4402|nr:hypothetical protein [Prescottella equi]MBM4489701.1 hypothetical protein [Prescottella equi]MBM4512202.1 hypothetical protein [Prescottella equi]MBM4515249.1 hypothetical protein [Prescottella equi]MBM4548522.1 hypothetical protein [Prescottella equi]MBM4685622.1 hypothetical protein [Prescottella equi]
MTDNTPTRAEEVRITGDLAQVIAAHAVRAIGPEGTVMRVESTEDTEMARAMFIGKLADAAIKIANGEPLK